MSLHVTITNKDVGARLPDGRHALPLTSELGTLPYVVVPDGTYILIAQVNFEVIEKPDVDIDLFMQRYPSGDSTAQTSICPHHRNDGRAFTAFPGKIIVRADSTSPSVAQAVGIDAECHGGRVKLDNIVLKFLRQRDE